MTAKSNKETAIEFLSLCASGDVLRAFEQHAGPHFKHHNPHFKSDRDSLIQAMQESDKDEPNKAFNVKQAIADGDTVAVYSELQRAEADIAYAVVHIAKFENGKIVEMWDVVQEVPKDSPNDLGMF
jgi:predicted SnoaL-like aldol condensation-catalyzing enzyme